MSAINLVHTGESVEVTFDACTREPLSWKEELYSAARNIASKSSKPLWLCSSGGIDSEIMCQAFYDQGINFSVLTLSHREGTNEHDIAFARAWCRKHDVDQKILSIDMEKFLGSDIPRYIEEGYIADHPFRYLQIRLMETVEKLGGFAVLAGGEQYYKVDADQPELSREDVFLEFDADKVVPLEWIKKNGVVHEPYFMYATSELCLSYLRIPLIDFALDHPDILRHSMSAFTLKRLAFQSVWLEHASRPKYHGFEKIEAETIALKKILREKFSAQLQIYRMSIPEFSKQLTAKLH